MFPRRVKLQSLRHVGSLSGAYFEVSTPVANALTIDSVRLALGAARATADPDLEVQRFAAVALVLLEHSEGLHLLLIQRTARADDPWSGHVAFPGGRHEPGDASLLATATRETFEEVGLDLATGATYVGTLPDIVAMAQGRRLDLSIRPFVFHLTRSAALVPDPREVADAFWVDLAWLASGQADTTYRYQPQVKVSGHSRMAYQLPAYQVEGRVVWGLTYRMLSTFLQRLQ